MVNNSQKQRISITVDADLLAEVDRLTKNRSAAVEEGLRLWRQQQIEEQAEELKATNEKLSDLNGMKDKFFSIIGHDLKNPINIILGLSDLMRVRFTKMADEKKIKSHEVIVDQVFERSSI